MVWHFCLFKNFPVLVIHIAKGFRVVSEVDVFVEFLCFLYDLTIVGYLITGSSAISKPGFYIWKFSVHVILKLNLKDLEHNLASM